MLLLEKLKSRLPPLPRAFRPRQPAIAVELCDEYLSMVRLQRDGDAARVTAFHVADLPPGALRSSPVHQNVRAPETLAPIVKAARESVAPAGGPIALCLPDAAVRVALIQAETVPRNRQELRELVAWRMKKTLPFRLDEAHVETQSFVGRGGRHVILALAARRSVLAEYEGLLEQQGFQVGSVTLASLALADLTPPAGEQDSLFLNVGAGWFSVLITSATAPVFFRCKVLPESERHGAERDWFVSGEVFPTLEYYRNRLGGTGPGRFVVNLEGTGGDELLETITAATELAAEPLVLPALDDVPPEARPRLGAAVALAGRGVPRGVHLSAPAPLAAGGAR